MTDTPAHTPLPTMTEAQKAVVISLPVVRGRRNGLFWQHNDANILADLSHMGLCKMPFIDRWGISGCNFVARIKTAGMSTRAALSQAGGAGE